MVRGHQKRAEDPSLARYRQDIVAYAAEKHGIWLWSKQAAVARALLEPPHRVLVKSANGIGKTKLSGTIAAWFYDCYDPGIGVITAPRADQIKDTTFKEVRACLAGRPGLYPKAPRIESSPTHYLNGTTAADANAFQGIHGGSLLVLFEEAMGIDRQFWEATRGILAGGENTYWCAIFNPTDATGHAHAEEISGGWTVISIATFEHPNIAAELLGHPAPIPEAVRLQALLDNMRDWGDAECAWPDERQARATDVDLHDPATYGLEPGATEITVRVGKEDRLFPFSRIVEAVKARFPGRWWRPAPEGEARVCGRYPSQSATAIFSDAAFDLACRLRTEFTPEDKVFGGADIARFGDDSTCIHFRRGIASLSHDAYRGQDTAHTAGKIKERSREHGPHAGQHPTHVRVNIDDTGVGGGVTDQRGEHAFCPINNGQKAVREDLYPNARSEMLFNLAEKMADGKVDLSRLPKAQQQAIRQQAVGITYRLDAAGRRVAETKADIKKRLGRSPDDLEALALCHYQPVAAAAAGESVRVVRTRARPLMGRQQEAEPERDRDRDRAGGSRNPLRRR